MHSLPWSARASHSSREGTPRAEFLTVRRRTEESKWGRMKVMTLPRSVARFNRRATNRVLGSFVPFLPTFAFVIHAGRKTSRQYRTPVNAFLRGGHYLIGLPYGRDSDWVLNVLAAGGCILEVRRRRLRLTRPRLIPAKSGISMVPAPLRVVGRLGLLSDFLDLELDQEERNLQAVRTA
jgi:deazaflavin-dependent oxidoreductase (nitroreductase family)